MGKSKKILFVVHEASRTGAPILLLDMIRRFKQNSAIPFQILIVQDGNLTDEYRKLGETLVWFKHNHAGSGIGILGKLVGKAMVFFRMLYIFFRIRGANIVFLNTLSNGHIHKKLLWLKCIFICYVHELETVIRVLNNPQTLATTIKYTDHFVAVSEAVRNNLVQNLHISNQKISILYPSVSISDTLSEKREEWSLKFRKDYDIGNSEIIVGVLGSSEWRKGFDLFVPLLNVYASLYPQSQVRFIWKGYRTRNDSVYYDSFDLQKTGLDKKVLFLDHGTGGLELMSSFDIHLLLSREDPYPLVVLEAAAFSVPTIAFDNAGGCREFIEDDAGILVPYGDLLRFAQSLHLLVTAETLRHQLGARARNKLRERHDPQKSAEKFKQLMEVMLLPGIEVNSKQANYEGQAAIFS
jgi:glycosyltransferase involved in cell wall biosynthesis